MSIKSSFYLQCVVVKAQYYVALRVKQEGTGRGTWLECEFILARRRRFYLDVL
jgi:hypothetical protein